MEKGIFKRADIRGFYPSEINENVAAKIGFCTAKMTTGKKVLLGLDRRDNSQKLAQALVFGLNQTGKEIDSLGQIPIEVFYFVVGKNDFDLGIYITGSHCEWRESGFKIVEKNTIPFATDGKLDELKKIFLKTDFQYQNTRSVDLQTINALPLYKDFISSQIDINNLRGKIQFISLGGIAEELIKTIFQDSNLNLKIQSLFQEDLNNLPPNPLLKEIQVLLKDQFDQTVDLIAVTDGDGDRAIFFDPQTKDMIFPDFIAAILAQSILSQEKGPIVFDCSKKMALAKIAKNLGIEFFQTKVGYPFVKSKMREMGAVFGGEVSGHYFYPHNFYSESSILTIGLVLQYLNNNNLSLSNAVAELKKEIFSLPQENLQNIDFEKTKENLLKEFSEAKSSFLDGLILETENWYLNIRPSQNEPLVRLNLETNSEKTLEDIYQRVKKQLI